MNNAPKHHPERTTNTARCYCTPPAPCQREQGMGNAPGTGGNVASTYHSRCLFVFFVHRTDTRIVNKTFVSCTDLTLPRRRRECPSLVVVGGGGAVLLLLFLLLAVVAFAVVAVAVVAVAVVCRGPCPRLERSGPRQKARGDKSTECALEEGRLPQERENKLKSLSTCLNSQGFSSVVRLSVVGVVVVVSLVVSPVANK